jgi:hypothetical protein
MAASIAGVNWRAVRFIRDCRRGAVCSVGRCVPGASRVSSSAVSSKQMVSVDDYDEF